MRIGFSDKNWVGIGLNWVRFHFLKKSKLAKSSMFNEGFAFFELGSFSRFYVFASVTVDDRHHGPPIGGMKNAVRRLDSRKGIWFMGIFRWQLWQTGKFFNWGKPAGWPYQTSVTLDPIGGSERRRWQ
jgi:hypothetical protein